MKTHWCLFIVIGVIVSISGCSQSSDTAPPPLDREGSIPPGAQKMVPENDTYPPILHSADFEMPTPLSGGINTAGLEDSPFFMPEKDELYFFFTPDASVPAEKQLFDGVTGIYVSRKVQGTWDKPERLLLQTPRKLALDGCPYIQGDLLWFCSAREGYAGMNWFTARRSGVVWEDWRYVDFDPDYQVGELHIHGEELYYHSAKNGTRGSLDIWVMKKVQGQWSDPENIGAVNTAASESLPCISPGGDELWFTREYFGTPAIFRSKRGEGGWQAPELIISQFAGEPTVDAYGNLYFVHHYFRDGTMIESDIYLAHKKGS